MKVQPDRLRYLDQMRSTALRVLSRALRPVVAALKWLGRASAGWSGMVPPQERTNPGAHPQQAKQTQPHTALLRQHKHEAYGWD